MTDVEVDFQIKFGGQNIFAPEIVLLELEAPLLFLRIIYFIDVFAEANFQKKFQKKLHAKNSGDASPRHFAEKLAFFQKKDARLIFHKKQILYIRTTNQPNINPIQSSKPAHK